MYIKPDDTFRTDGEQVANPGEVIMHGDVYLVPVTKTPEIASPVKEPNSCLAYGEFTGHAHKLFGGEYELTADSSNPLRALHLRVITPTSLRHQEHTPIVIPPGDYTIGIQQEADPFEDIMRNVAD